MAIEACVAHQPDKASAYMGSPKTQFADSLVSERICRAPASGSAPRCLDPGQYMSGSVCGDLEFGWTRGTWPMGSSAYNKSDGWQGIQLPCPKAS